MNRILFLIAFILICTIGESQKIPLINSGEIIERGKVLYDSEKYEEAIARGGVYYEAGFAKGLGREVVWTVKKELIDKNLVHFDTRQFNHIAWETTEDLRKKLSQRIVATLDQGPIRK